MSNYTDSTYFDTDERSGDSHWLRAMVRRVQAAQARTDDRREDECRVAIPPMSTAGQREALAHAHHDAAWAVEIETKGTGEFAEHTLVLRRRADVVPPRDGRLQDHPDDRPLPLPAKTGRASVRLINYTPHTVTLLCGALATPFDSLGVARCEEIVSDDETVMFDYFDDCGSQTPAPIVRKRYGVVTGLPAQQDGVLIIVSQLVADACPERRDLIVPHDVIRVQGQVVGCRGFSRRAA